LISIKQDEVERQQNASADIACHNKGAVMALASVQGKFFARCAVRFECSAATGSQPPPEKREMLGPIGWLTVLKSPILSTPAASEGRKGTVGKLSPSQLNR